MIYTITSSSFTSTITFNEKFIVIHASPQIAWMKGYNKATVDMICIRRGYRLEAR